MKKEKNKAVNSDAYKFLQSFLHSEVKILDVEVCGKWLKAFLSSNIKFSVKNRSVD